MHTHIYTPYLQVHFLKLNFITEMDLTTCSFLCCLDYKTKKQNKQIPLVGCTAGDLILCLLIHPIISASSQEREYPNKAKS